MNLSTNQRIIIITVFAAYTIFQLVYSLVTRKAMANGKGDYLSKFYTGGRSGGVLVTAMMVSAGVAGAGVFIWVYRVIHIHLVRPGWSAVSGPCARTSWYSD